MLDILEQTRGCIFDYGGTLDTGGCHWGRYIWRAYRRQGVPVSEPLFRDAYVYAERELGRNPIIQSDYTFRKTLSAKLRIEMEYVASKVGGFDLPRWHDAVLADLYAAVKVETAHSRQVLESVGRQRPMVLVSNFYGNINTVLAEFGLDGLFSGVVESAVVGVRKPDPRIFLLGVESLGMAPHEVAVVGDSYAKDIEPAHEAGCRTVWMRGEGWTGNDPADAGVADATITALADLL